MDKEKHVKSFNLCEVPRKQSYQNQILLDIPSITTPYQETVQEVTEEEIVMNIPTIRRHRNSVFIRPDTRKLSLSQQTGFESLESTDGGNNNDVDRIITHKTYYQDHQLFPTSKPPVTIQASSFEDFLAYEQDFYRACDKPIENEQQIIDLSYGDTCKSPSKKICPVQGGADCCICRLPGTKDDDYLSQGRTCLSCCFMQAILLVLHMPVLSITFIKWLFNFCKCHMTCKSSTFETSTMTCDEIDTIEIEDFDYFWPPIDIAEDQVDNYKNTTVPVLTSWRKHKREASLELIKSELKVACRSNFIRRFEVLLGLLDGGDMERLKEFGLELGRMAITSGYIDIVKMLISKMDKDLKPTSSDKIDVSALHIAILNSHPDLVDLILDKFCPEDQCSLLHTRASKRASDCFASVELPLNLAVWIGHEGILENLVRRGAELCEQDSNGYNVFHTVVLMSEENPQLACKLFDKLVDLVSVWVKVSKKFTFFHSMSAKSSHIVAMEMMLHAHDKDCFTPLQLAAKLGVHGIMNKILNTEDVYKFAYRSLGPKSQVMYDVTEIDPFLVLNEETPSVLELLVMRYSNMTLQCVGIQPITELIEAKCDHYWSYVSINAFFHFCFMVLYNASAYKELFPYLAPAANATDDDQESYPMQSQYKQFGLVDWFILAFATFYFLYAVLASIVVWKIIKKVKAKGSDTLWLTNTLQLQTLLMFSLSAIIYLILKGNSHLGQVYALAFSMLFGWLHMILYTRGFKATAFFAIMVHKVLFGDVLRFLCVILIIVLGYSMATTAIFFAINTQEINPIDVMLSFLKLATGISDFGPLAMDITSNVWTAILYISFIILANVLLFNLLIAAMSTTFSKISEHRDVLCQKVRISDIIVLEQMLPLWLQRGVLTLYKRRWAKIYMPGGAIIKKEMFLIVCKQQREVNELW